MQKQITAVNPATLETLGTVAVTSTADIDRSVQTAQQAQKAWAQVPISERLRYIEQFRRVVFARRNQICKAVTQETGKPFGEALVSEIFGVLETCQWLQGNAARHLKPEPTRLNSLFMPGKKAYTVYEPLGIIAVIAPYNYPFSIPVSTMVAALAAGNAVILKPSPKAALVAEQIAELFEEAQFPSGLISVVQGDNAEAEYLIKSSIDRVMFTGSVRGGRAIAALAAEKLLPVTLELGGKHAAIVLDDCRIDAVARPIVWAAFTNAGQACASIERVYVQRSIAPALTARIAELAAQLRLGNGMQPDTDVGPLIDEAQLNRLKGQVEDAVAEGARVLCGGRERRELGGWYFEPTVIANASQNMRVIREEIFGPLLPIVEVDSEDEAVRLANDSDLGLGASVWSGNLQRAQALARRINAGMVWINDGLYTHVSPDAPWGGIKNSGYGRMHSAAELRDLVYAKSIGLNAQQEQRWNFPYSTWSLNYISGGVELLHGSLPERLQALKKLVHALLTEKRG